MDKATQNVWDNCLIRNYGFRHKMGRVVFLFILETRPDLISEENRITEEGFDYFDSLELRRCKDRLWCGDLKFVKYKQSVDDFIGSHCLPLLLALADRKITNSQIIENISAYKWVRHNQKIRAKSNYRAKKKGLREYYDKNGGEKGIRIEIHPRERDKRTDWGTVK